jgi:hypothetical protein
MRKQTEALFQTDCVQQQLSIISIHYAKKRLH